MISQKVKDIRTINNELPVSVNIPFSSHVAKDTIKNHSGDYLRVFRVDGIAHESADEDNINTWHEQLNMLYRNIASPNVGVWTNIVRREESAYPDGVFPPGFARQLNEKYKKHINSGNTLLVNEIYITIILRPHSNGLEKVFNKVTGASKKDLEDQQHSAIEKLDELGESVIQALGNYNPEVLKIYEKNNVLYSEVLEFFGFLVNGEWQPIPLQMANIRRFIATSRLFFGSESIAFRTPVAEKHGAVLGIKEYPSITGPGILDGLLQLPFEFVLTQSFVFVPKQKAISDFTRQINVMINAGDLAESQINELKSALDDLQSNRFVIGHYHFSLLVMGDSGKALRENVGAARSALADTGMVVAREDMVNEAAFWAQLPGNFEFRTRPAQVTSRNFAGLSAFHNFPSGKKDRNHWGPAVTLLKTASGTPFYFNFHQADLGNFLIIGPSGSGKTVAQLFLLAQLQKFNPRCVFFDKDEGAKIFVKRMGGNYQSIKIGSRTGWNPLLLDPTPENVDFWNKLIKRLTKHPSRPITAIEEAQIASALRGILEQPKSERRLTQLLNYFPSNDPEGLYYRLEQWTHGHARGWVFDNATDDLDFRSNNLFGFDLTKLLDDDDVKAPVLMYLMYRMEDVIDGGRFAAFIDEFWKYLLDQVFEDFARDKLKVIRKQNGFIGFGTQSASDPLLSPIAKTIIEQAPTKIFMPNPEADRADLVDGFNLTEREFEIVKTLPVNSRMFLIKQGNNSVIAELNLKGFDDELAILSGTTANNELLDVIIAEVGEDPEVWEPIFQKRRKKA